VPLTDPLINTLGVAELLKKPGGYVNVMKLPIASAPPAVVVKLNVAATFALSATRSESLITNESKDTRPPIAVVDGAAAAVDVGAAAAVVDRVVDEIKTAAVEYTFVPDATLYKSTALDCALPAATRYTDGHSPTLVNPNSSPSTNHVKLQLPPEPPAKMATFPTDVAARLERVSLSCAVDHVPDVMLYKSTALERKPPAVTPVRRQPPAQHTQQSNKPHASNTQTPHNRPHASAQTAAPQPTA
jgi:hypothetical protein